MSPIKCPSCSVLVSFSFSAPTTSYGAAESSMIRSAAECLVFHCYKVFDISFLPCRSPARRFSPRTNYFLTADIQELPSFRCRGRCTYNFLHSFLTVFYIFEWLYIPSCLSVIVIKQSVHFLTTVFCSADEPCCADNDPPVLRILENPSDTLFASC